MSRQKGQLMRFSDPELSLMKALFAENDDLLFLIRKILFQFEITDAERKSIKKITSQPVLDLIRKIFLPNVEADAPLFQMMDAWNALNVEIKSNKSEDEMLLQIEAKEIEIAYLEQQLLEIESGKRKTDIVFADLIDRKEKDLHKKYINIIARNYLFSYIDSNVQQVMFLAGKKEETVEQTVERLKKDSSK